MLTHQNIVPIRFSEVDSLKVVWHGNYVKYFEDGRDSFGLTHNLSYLDVCSNGYVTPIVKLNIDFKKSLKYGENAIIKTTYVNTPAAKLIFDYKIFRSTDHALAATGQTTQVFLNMEGELSLVVPQFIVEWKKKWQVQ